MREIKFRGLTRRKNSKWSGWHYGDLWHEKSGICVGSYEVDPETVGQYTGLPDINGKDIYEGDIIQFPKPPYFLSAEPILTASVVYEYGQFLVIYHGARFTIFNIINDVTVIGNIYDNPELLTNGKD